MDRHATVLQPGYVKRQGGPKKTWRTLDELYTIDPVTECWNWNLAINREGYGSIRDGKNVKYAHRFMYELMVGPIPKEKQLDHLCRNRRCVNPDHLEPVVAAVNVRRGRNAKLTPDQVIEIRSLGGTMPQREIANIFRVSSPQVCRILSGRRWHDPDDPTMDHDHRR